MTFDIYDGEMGPWASATVDQDGRRARVSAWDSGDVIVHANTDTGAVQIQISGRAPHHDTTCAREWAALGTLYELVSHEAIAEALRELRRRLSAPGQPNQPSPRYDDVYRDGVAWLEELAEGGK